eukprot:CAMPEP_0178399916 /NCGR_PEP_ID=MMETSP0689_2-20121128/15522_1 /TAXON_ID=160604 /ORGANISM="Amphidinium massartii, Strain CS-259" /LENGTH=483 /DNA_ID=CAMNT_0020020699 /DNA_START=99 /DNA_END=1547 /DNA_ORIENTATION=-
MPAFERHLARFEVEGESSKAHYLDVDRPASPLEPEQAPRLSSMSRSLSRNVSRPVLLPIHEQQSLSRSSSKGTHSSKSNSGRHERVVRLPSKGHHQRRSPSWGASWKETARDRASSTASTSLDSMGCSPSWCSSASCLTPQSLSSPSSFSSPNSRLGDVPSSPSGTLTPPRKATVTLPPTPGSPPMSASKSSPALNSRPSSSSGPWQGDVRLLLIRHAQSANKGRRHGQKACPDPELTDLGYDQANMLAKRMSREFRQKRPNLLIVSSPMRRCLLTILPSLKLLPIEQENCLCHGSCYEYGAVGKHFRGTHSSDISSDFPDFKLLGFNAEGHWDSNIHHEKEKEDDSDCRARGQRVKSWLVAEAVPKLREISKDVPVNGLRSRELPTVAFVTHQTIADLLCHLFLESSADEWRYGDIRYRLSNASMSEIIIHADGSATMGDLNDGSHLIGCDASSMASTFAGSGWGASSTWGGRGARSMAATW